MMFRLASLVFVAALLLGDAAFAQTRGFSVAARDCVKPGAQVTLNGAGLGTAPVGEIMMRSRGARLDMQVTSWSDRRLRARVPSRRVKAGEYEVVWVRTGRVVASFGALEVCGNTRTARPSTERAGKDEVAAPNGAPEYVVSVSQGQAAAAANALQAQGVQVLRTRQLNALGRTLLIVSLPGNLSRTQAQAILNGTVNGAQIDVHNIYGFVAGPRVYAAQAIGDDPGGVCRLRRAVAVGVIDGPVNPGHSALKGTRITRTSVLGQRDRTPSAAHGTAVVSLISGNGSGEVQGFAMGANVFAVSAFTVRKGQTGATLEHVAAALDWLAGKRVQIVNMSFAGRPNSAFRDVLAAGARRGMVMIAAAGNDGKAVAAYPAGAPEVIAVTAVDARGKLYRKANRGKHIEFAAPGVDVYTAKGNKGGYQSGTSFSTPIVTALVARQAAKGRVSAKSVRAALAKRASDLGSKGRDQNYGWGLVQSSGC